MARTLELVPDGWEVPFTKCRAGLFVTHDGNVGLKTEYGTTEGFCESGESFANKEALVTPVIPIWKDDD